MERDTQHVKWQNSLKSAIVTESFIQIQELLDNTPMSNDVEVLSVNLALLEEAIKLYETKQQKILTVMKNIQKSKQYLKSPKTEISKKILA
jgi:NADH:ubiquinone oxidoreductase subunit E